jgi:hypothetical protein
MSSLDSQFTIPVRFYNNFGYKQCLIPFEHLQGTCIGNCIDECGFHIDDPAYEVPIDTDADFKRVVKQFDIDINYEFVLQDTLKYLKERQPVIKIKKHFIGGIAFHPERLDGTYGLDNTTITDPLDYISIKSNPDAISEICGLIGNQEFVTLFAKLRILDFLGLNPNVEIVSLSYKRCELTKTVVSKTPSKSARPPRKAKQGAMKCNPSKFNFNYCNSDEPDVVHPVMQADDDMCYEMQEMYKEFLSMAVDDCE